MFGLYCRGLLYRYVYFSDEELTKLGESEEKTRQQLAEVTRREALLLKTLTEKEREIADLAVSTL